MHGVGGEVDTITFEFSWDVSFGFAMVFWGVISS